MKFHVFLWTLAFQTLSNADNKVQAKIKVFHSYFVLISILYDNSQYIN